MKEKALKIIIIMAIACVILGASGLSPIQKTRAITIATIIDIPRFIQWIKDLYRDYIKEYMDYYRDLVIKMIIQRMENDIVDSINNGGKPRFVTNWKSLANDAGNLAFSVLDKALKENGVNLCGPFEQQLRMELRVMYKYYDARYETFPTTCRFETFKYNLENAVNFIERGDWVSYDAIFSPDSNPNWLSLQMEDSFIKKRNVEEKTNQAEAESSQGFLSAKVCSDEQAKTEAEQFCQENEQGSETPDVKGCVARVLKNTCTKWDVQTPGDVFANAAMKSIGGDMDYAVNVKKAITAIVNAMINKMLKKGLANVTKDTTDDTVYGEEGGDVPPGYGNVTTQQNIQTLKDFRSRYESVVVFTESPLIPLVQQAQSLLSSTGANQCASSTVINIQEGEKITPYYIGDVVQLVNELAVAFGDASQVAQERINEIDALLAQEKIESTDAIELITKANTFFADPVYVKVFEEVAMLQEGQDGQLSAALNNIIIALDSFSCSPIVQ